MRKEGLPPVFRADPLQELASLISDSNLSPVEIFYEAALAEIKRKGFI